ncbi:hypothetical protein COCCADRAFT_103237, partial [Bipolaris zeicola 26-R-13]
TAKHRTHGADPLLSLTLRGLVPALTSVEPCCLATASYISSLSCLGEKQKG